MFWKFNKGWKQVRHSCQFLLCHVDICSELECGGANNPTKPAKPPSFFCKLIANLGLCRKITPVFKAAGVWAVWCLARLSSWCITPMSGNCWYFWFVSGILAYKWDSSLEHRSQREKCRVTTTSFVLNVSSGKLQYCVKGKPNQYL